MDDFTRRMMFVLSRDDTYRIKVSKDGETPVVTVDLHGLNRYQAEKMLKNLLNVSRQDFKLNVIHGYNHGTVLKEMICNRFENSHIAFKRTDDRNMGLTHIMAKAA